MSSFFSKMEERNRINPEVSKMNPHVKSESFERNLEVDPASNSKEYISKTSEKNVWVNPSPNEKGEFKSSSSNGNIRIDPPSNFREESELLSSNGNVSVNPTANNEEESELFSPNGYVRVNLASNNEEESALLSSNANVWVNHPSNNEEESELLSSSGNVSVSPTSNNEEESELLSPNGYVRVNLASNNEKESALLSSNASVWVNHQSNNEEESELLSSNANVWVNPTSNNEEESELFSPNGYVRVNLVSNNEKESALLSSNANVWVNPTSNNGEESESLSSSGNVSVNLTSKSEDYFASYSEPLSVKASLKPETNNHVGSFVLDRQIKVEKVEAEEEVESGGTEIGDPDFIPEPDSVQSCNISIKLEELPEAPEASFPISPAVEIDVKEEFDFLSPFLESVKTEEPPVKSPNSQKQSFFKPAIPDASGQGPACNPFGLKPCYINVRRIDDKVAQKYPCEGCKESFSRKDNLARHKRYHCRGPLQRLKASPSTSDPNAPSTSTVGCKFTCRSCKALFYDKQNLKKHISYHCGGPLQRLGLNNPTSHGYFDRNIPTSSPRPQCEECGKYFSHPSCVKRHFVRYHLKPRRKADASVDKPFSCNHCQRTFKHRHRLLFHLSYHANSTKTCKICGETFGDSYAYNRHMRWGHRPPPEAPPECPTCGKVFGRKWDLKMHVKRGACRKPKKEAERVEHVCEHCGYAYRWKHSLLKHLQGRGKSCFPQGPRKFRKKPAGKVEYTCEHCAFSCFHKGPLVRHLRLRTQEPERVCQVCCERLGGPEKMREHLVLVHKIGESVDKQKDGSASELGCFVCEPCGLTFEEKDGFTRHVLQSHTNS